ncbi:unnamed protein product [Wuchereria bancrofti]|uniref:Uncharacterized protein n=4 Tax=Wuchereria bancrofti TaxID=6293 RepID=A0A3P7FN97_WUCBA|nr:unnamed protein product [Wuchereria bancrofti]
MEMEEVSLNMLLEPENTTISRIRERRRERILRNSDQRIRSILGGLDGAELRNAPALEGGEGFRNLVSPSETPIRTGYAIGSFLFDDREYYLALDHFLHLSSLCDAVGYFLQPRLHLGLNLLSHAGAVVQNIWCFIKESLVVALSFILFNALFCVFALIVDKCCSL